MSIFSIMYHLIIGPLELLFESIFAIAVHIMRPGFAIVFLSLAMNILVLPLYWRADALQAEERDVEARIGPGVRHIKKAFTGDERYMILQTYYRQNHYKPTYSLKGSVSLLLEIPFFLAAYQFLSHLEMLQGATLGPIRNLGAPDGLLCIGGLSINVLPVLMTVINLVSSAIYTKGLPTRSKVQLYLMAGLFLVLLYQSPSGLVFYWTLNNLFSLGKNIVSRMKHPKTAVCGLISAAGIGSFGLMLAIPVNQTILGILVAFALLCQLPLLALLLRKRMANRGGWLATVKNRPMKKSKGAFLLACLILTVLMGVLIPSELIKASPQEFIDVDALEGPAHYLIHSLELYAGFFLVWAQVFYWLSTKNVRPYLSLASFVFMGAAIVNYMFFDRDYGMISPDLKFDSAPVSTGGEILLNSAVLLALAIIICVLWQRKTALIRVVSLALVFAVSGMSGANALAIRNMTDGKLQEMREEERENKEIVLPLSRTGKNVIVIMMDRSVGNFIPHIFEEMPQLKENYDGFRIYPNTVSHGPATNFGLPGAFGGYEYTPLEMNKRDQEPLKLKHNEAMKVMPALFDQNGYEVTVCDPTWAGYTWISDLSIYDDYPEVNAYHLIGAFTEQSPGEAAKNRKNRENKFVGYSLFKTTPTLLKSFVYNQGKYNQIRHEDIQLCENSSVASGFSLSFMRSYDSLKKLPELSTVRDTGKCGSFIMMCNNATHEPVLLQKPDYEPAEKVDNTAWDLGAPEQLDPIPNTLNPFPLNQKTIPQITEYHCNAASYIQLGNWFRYLREQGVYDNTRIIIVADHGNNIDISRELMFPEKGNLNVMMFNPVLMVKDFDSTGYVIDNTFMTNADVPSLAIEGLIGEKINPFTGKEISMSPKTASKQYVLSSMEWDANRNNGHQFLPGLWYTVENNIFDGENWTLVSEEDLPLN